jgi:formylglycine-generating enzyme required for sulfatase activity
MTSRPLRVFLCHSSADKPAVRELYQKLRAEAWIQPWLDEEELFPGMDWNMEIEKTIEATDVILVCLSNNSITKEGYVQREIRIALDYADYKPEETLFIIPVRLEECTPPKRLARWQYADYFEGNRERALQRLLVSLKRRADSLGVRTESPDPVGQDFNQTPVDTPKPAWLDKEINRLKERKPASEVLQTPPAWLKKGGDGISKFISDSQNKLTLSNGMEFMRVPAGSFLMGSDDGEKNEVPKHTVDIPYDYWMARYPATNEKYDAYIKSIGAVHPVDRWERRKKYPVVYVNWLDAMEYCRWLYGQFENEIPVGLVFRLPTESEWEKAARGVDGRDYPWGDKFIKDICNTSESGRNETTSIGLYSPQADSHYGCAGMSGNIWEWTHSLKKGYPYRIDDGREDERLTGHRMLRGGSFFDNAHKARCAYRYDSAIDISDDDNGFRVCLAPPLPK